MLTQREEEKEGRKRDNKGSITRREGEKNIYYCIYYKIKR